ncbi:MAG: hypothetical protein ACREKS_14130 [Candidatus Rokuibacteriota bacterium]
MKKHSKSGKAPKKPVGTKAVAKKTPAAKAAPKKRTATAGSSAPAASVGAARYTPPPLQADGWRPFRYPPQ